MGCPIKLFNTADFPAPYASITIQFISTVFKAIKQPINLETLTTLPRTTTLRNVLLRLDDGDGDDSSMSSSARRAAPCIMDWESWISSSMASMIDRRDDLDSDLEFQDLI